MVDVSGAFPSLTGYILQNTVTNPLTQAETNTVTTTVSYSDGRPDEVSVIDTAVNFNWTETQQVFEKDVYQGSGADQDQLTTRQMTQTQWVHQSPQPTTTTSSSSTTTDDVVVTTKIDTVTYALVTTRQSRDDVTVLVTQGYVRAYTFIYGESTGNAQLDQMFGVPATYGTFLPYIPLRIDNTNIGDFSPEGRGTGVPCLGSMVREGHDQGDRRQVG